MNCFANATFTERKGTCSQCITMASLQRDLCLQLRHLQRDSHLEPVEVQWLVMLYIRGLSPLSFFVIAHSNIHCCKNCAGACEDLQNENLSIDGDLHFARWNNKTDVHINLYNVINWRIIVFQTLLCC